MGWIRISKRFHECWKNKNAHRNGASEWTTASSKSGFALAILAMMVFSAAAGAEEGYKWTGETPINAKALHPSMTLEPDTDRPGQNLRVFDLAAPDPALCSQACGDDTQCRAYTYVRPGVQGPKARCWLKTGVPSAKPSPCCVSGVKTDQGGVTLPPPPREGTPVQGDSDIDPYSVKFYRLKNYRNDTKGPHMYNPLIQRGIAPGMRLLKVDKVLGKISKKIIQPEIGSILIGSKVGVILFPDPDLTSHLKKLKSYDSVTIPPFAIGAKTNKKYWLIHSKRIESSTPEINIKYFPRVGSFIIYRKDIKDVLGVLLQLDEEWAKFLPLPESPSQTDIIYNKIPAGGPFKLSLTSGSKGQWVLKTASGKGHPRPDDVQVFVEGTSGKTVKLIEPNSQETEFDLEKKGIHQVSSIRIIYKGPFNHPSAYFPSQPKAHRAPPVPTPPPHVSPKVIWPEFVSEGRPLAIGPMTVEPDTDRPGANLRAFDLDAADPQLCAQACQEDLQCRAYTYVKPGVQGPKARCWLKSGVPPAKSAQCCISGVKTQ